MGYVKDLDFDELDRAVNSLLANGPNTNSDDVAKNTTTIGSELPKTPINSHFTNSISPINNFKSNPVTPPAVDNPTLNEATSPIEATSTQVEVKVIKPIPTIPIFAEPTRPLASRRSSGRFMDVVHPSSDMRTTLIMPDRVSRQGTTINLSSVEHTAVTEPVVVETVIPQPEPIERPVVTAPVANAWPDPIDFGDKVEIKLPVPAVDDNEDSEDDDIDRISDDIDNTLNRAPEVQESPFLSGAKVSKRPLGAFSGDNSLDYIEISPVAEAPATEKASESDEDANMNNTDQIDVDVPLPAELMSDLLTIEAANEVETSDSSVVSPSPETVPYTAPASPVVQAPEAVIENDPPKVIPNTDGPTSISQQYKEKPSTSDQNSTAIYDTAAYHKAIVGKPTKKSHLFLILWILLLLAIGAGAGAAIYFFVLPLL